MSSPPSSQPFLAASSLTSLRLAAPSVAASPAPRPLPPQRLTTPPPLQSGPRSKQSRFLFIRVRPRPRSTFLAAPKVAARGHHRSQEEPRSAPMTPKPQASTPRASAAGSGARDRTSSVGAAKRVFDLRYVAAVEVPRFELDEDPAFWKDHNVQVHGFTFDISSGAMVDELIVHTDLLNIILLLSQYTTYFPLQVGNWADDLKPLIWELSNADRNKNYFSMGSAQSQSEQCYHKKSQNNVLVQNQILGCGAL